MVAVELYIVVPGADVTKSPPPVVFCQVGVSHIYVTESQPPDIFMPTQVSRRRLQKTAINELLKLKQNSFP